VERLRHDLQAAPLTAAMEPSRTALVTGASSGIGAAIAQSLAADGWQVAVNYRSNRDGAEALVERIAAASGAAAAMQADVSKRESVADLFARVEARFGEVGYLVNNAGVTRDGALAFLSDEQWDEVIDTNLRGTYLCSQAALPNLMRSGGGDLQYRVAQRRARPGGTDQLLRVEGGDHRVHEGACARGRSPECAGQRGVPWVIPTRDVGQIHPQGRVQAAGGYTSRAFRAAG